MSNYERWVIYPLLIFAISLSLKGLVVEDELRLKFVTCDHLVCHQITVNSLESESKLMHLGQNPTVRTAEMTLYGEGTQPVVRLGLEPGGKVGSVELQRLRVKDAEGEKRLVEIGSGANGIGEIALFGAKDDKPAVTLGAAEQGSVLRAVRGDKDLQWPAE